MSSRFDAKGFTLIELLVVIAIISVLSAVVLASLNTARAKARDARRLSDLHELTTALQAYYQDNGSYPGYGCSSIGTGSNGEAYGLGTTSAYRLNPQFEGVYMSSLPADPIYGNSGRQGNYMYFTNGSTNGTASRITLCAYMESNGGNGHSVANACGGTFTYNYCIYLPD